jgi:hypothetical protein
MWPAISIQSNENVRSAIVNCLCSECGGAIELHSNQFRDAWVDVENIGERFGKAQSATPRNHGQPIITVAFAELEGECWQDK